MHFHNNVPTANAILPLILSTAIPNILSILNLVNMPKRKYPATGSKFINHTKTVLLRGKEVYEQINILGDDGVPVDYHVTYWKSEVIDFVILQQDAFDKIDQSTPIERQQFMLEHVLEICDSDFNFDSFD